VIENLDHTAHFIWISSDLFMNVL